MNMSEYSELRNGHASKPYNNKSFSMSRFPSSRSIN